MIAGRDSGKRVCLCCQLLHSESSTADDLFELSSSLLKHSAKGMLYYLVLMSKNCSFYYGQF